MENTLENQTYPFGRFVPAADYTRQDLIGWIESIRTVPLLLDHCIENLDEAQLNTPYRAGGWNTNQVIHHVADSHMNAYIRLKLTLTEERPIIKPYDEKRWAELPDVTAVPLNISITLIHALHERWTSVLRQLDDLDWARTYHHPGDGTDVPLWQMTKMYSWHGRHHAEQIRFLRRRMGW
jgi:hypothetical protein